MTAPRIDVRRCQEIVEGQLGYDPGSVGHADSQLVVLSGGHAEDRDKVACEVSCRYGSRCALVASAHLGHVVLGDRNDHVGALVAQTAAFALDPASTWCVTSRLTSVRDQQVLVDLGARHRGRPVIFELGSGPTPPVTGTALDLGDGIDRALEDIIDHLEIARRAAQ